MDYFRPENWLFYRHFFEWLWFIINILEIILSILLGLFCVASFCHCLLRWNVNILSFIDNSIWDPESLSLKARFNWMIFVVQTLSAKNKLIELQLCTQPFNYARFPTYHWTIWSYKSLHKLILAVIKKYWAHCKCVKGWQIRHRFNKMTKGRRLQFTTL